MIFFCGYGLLMVWNFFKGTKGPPPPQGASRAKVMSILEKARNAMEKGNSYHPPSTTVHHHNNHERRTSSR